jgi:hypothetical protein
MRPAPNYPVSTVDAMNETDVQSHTPAIAKPPTVAPSGVESSNPGALVEAAVESCLELARTWLAWDGQPSVAEDGARIYTPHKAIRRIADHIVDHLAEVEALLAGVPTQPDEWHASLLTFDSDWARFTEGDLDEARQRLRRLGRTFALRLAAAGPAEWDIPRGENRTLRETSEHLADSTWYANQLGDLGSPPVNQGRP